MSRRVQSLNTSFNPDVAYALLRAVSRLVSAPAEVLPGPRRREKSRRGTHECVRHIHGIGLCEASQATTSETSSGDIGLPGTLPRQSGAPISGRPAMTVVRRLRSLTKPTAGPSTREL